MSTQPDAFWLQTLAHRRARGVMADLPAAVERPQSSADAFALQQQFAAGYGEVIGWKCGVPGLTEAGQPKWVVAPLYQRELQQGAECALWPSVKGLARVEPEYAYPLLADLPAFTALSQADAPVSADLSTDKDQSAEHSVDHSAEHALYPDQLADGLFNQGLWLGPVLNGPEQASFTLTLNQAGQKPVTHAARHPNDNPRAPLPWLVNFLRAQGVPLTAGQVIITGSFAGVLELPLGSHILWQFGAEPAFQLSFCPR